MDQYFPHNWQQEAVEAAEVMRKGGAVLYPTDTIWGLGCDARDDQAIERIRNIKGREETKSFIVLVKDITQLQHYVEKVPEQALTMIRETSRPLTIIYEGVRDLAEAVYAKDGTVAIRVPEDDFCKSLIAALGRPIVSTSANLSGQSTKGDFQSIHHEIKEQVDYIVSYRQAENIDALPSRIVKIENGEVNVIRE